jgi:hypothetical protein
MANLNLLTEKENHNRRDAAGKLGMEMQLFLP